MSAPNPDAIASAKVTMRIENDAIVVALEGGWHLRNRQPALPTIARMLMEKPARVLAIDGATITTWDSALVLFIARLRAEAAANNLRCELRNLPATVTELVGRVETEAPAGATDAGRVHLATRLGVHATDAIREGRDLLTFFGDCVLGLLEVCRRPFGFRWFDCLEQMRRCGASALPIVGLISALVGVILAFVAAEQLREFGADLYVADLVGLAVVREMGPMMAAVVLTGRTGAAFAAEIGNMVLGEEVDALETFGVRPRDFLVMPRLLALVLMMPLLAIYADFLGVTGGMFIARAVLDVSPQTFFTELQTAVSMSDIGTGLLKSVFFGWIVALSGCYRGMRTERSAVGVGRSTTGAVVMGILVVIVTDSVFTIVFNALRW